MNQFEKMYQLYKGTGAPKRCTCGMHFNCCCGGLHERERLFAVGNGNNNRSDRDHHVRDARTDEVGARYRDEEND